MFVPLSAIDLLLRLQAGGTAGTRLSRDLLGGLVPVGLVPVDLGWGGRVRTFAWRNQNPLPYHLATPQNTRLMAPKSLYLLQFPAFAFTHG